MNDTPLTTVQQRKKLKRPAEAIGGLLIGMTAISLIFGNAFVAFTLFAVVAAFFVLAGMSGDFRGRLQAFLQSREARSGLGLVVGALALVGIFGNAFLMTVVILLAGLAILLLSRGRQVPLHEMPQWNDAANPHPAPQALPTEAQGEKISELDVRALCRGLPPMQAGQVMAAVEELELAMVEAERRGNVKAAFDARQALTDYLPGTVEAWKAQRPEDQNVSELNRALEEVRAIAGSSDGSAQRRAWETQQRFLRSRTDANPGLLPADQEKS